MKILALLTLTIMSNIAFADNKIYCTQLDSKTLERKTQDIAYEKIYAKIDGDNVLHIAPVMAGWEKPISFFSMPFFQKETSAQDGSETFIYRWDSPNQLDSVQMSLTLQPNPKPNVYLGLLQGWSGKETETTLHLCLAGKALR